MPKKLTQEQAEADYLRCGWKLKEEYKGNRYSHLVERVECGHAATKPLKCAQRLRSCDACWMYSEEDIKQAFINVNFALTEPYGGDFNRPYKGYCLGCGFEYYKSLNTARNNCGCPQCFFKSQRYTKEEAEQVFLDIGVILDEPLNMDIQYRHDCHCIKAGHKTKKSIFNAQQKSQCRFCYYDSFTIYKDEISKRLAKNSRTRLATAMRQNLTTKKCSSVKDLGCSILELKVHLEVQWEPGMNWSNWGKGRGKWNIDHIRPLASFNWNDPEEQKKAVHYTNLQPLWEPDNLSKGAKWTP